ncbi:hypothetical protein [Streptomyces sp. A0958]|uniref:hypothetical protein n=1 Tax=Streptomyces sp. A0958 TaxID=2563101 RepID=UPI001448585D|nr:hypothetical protein [Streptomyces sp. A0958]
MSGARLAVEATALAEDPLGPPRYQDVGAAVRGPLVDVARHVRSLGVPAEGLCMVADPLTSTADLAVTALGRLGPPPGGAETLVLLQSGYDQEHHTVPLPRISHETPWEFTEEFGVSHATGLGGCADVFGLLAEVLPPGGRATVLIADHSEYGFAPALPSGVVVAVRVVHGPGPWRLTSGRGALPSAVPARWTGTGGWPQVLRLLGSIAEAAPSAPRAGLVASGACDREASSALRADPTTPGAGVPGIAGQAGRPAAPGVAGQTGRPEHALASQGAAPASSDAAPDAGLDAAPASPAVARDAALASPDAAQADAPASPAVAPDASPDAMQAVAPFAAQAPASYGPLLLAEAERTADGPWLLLEPAPGAGSSLRTGGGR